MADIQIDSQPLLVHSGVAAVVGLTQVMLALAAVAE
jgi:hypothetical protein